MKFAVKTWGKGKARTGELQLSSRPCSIETSSLLLSTRKGLPHFISPDLLHSLPFPDSSFLQVSPLHFLEGPSPGTISNLGGLHPMVGLREHAFAAVARDSIHCLPEYDGSNKAGASFETPSGRRLVKPAEYMELISSMKPNFWVALADEVPAWVSDKRHKTSVDRTVKWLDECIACGPTVGVVFGAIVGGSNVEEGKRCAQETAKRNVSGYWIGGFGLGESTDDRPALLNAVTESLPAPRPRLITGLGLPEEVLQGIAAGIDLFDSSYIYHLSLGGFALTFPLDGIELDAPDFQFSCMGNDSTKINLKATIYRKDTASIVEGCSCYTCQNHTKAYINHLLNVDEMLAQILLDMYGYLSISIITVTMVMIMMARMCPLCCRHNTHYCLGFFRAIRKVIKEDRFKQFHEFFLQRRRDHIAAAAICI